MNCVYIDEWILSLHTRIYITYVNTHIYIHVYVCIWMNWHIYLERGVCVCVYVCECVKTGLIYFKVFFKTFSEKEMTSY